MPRSEPLPPARSEDSCERGKEATLSCGDAPIVVDLDGTLTPTDTLIESLLALLKTSPLALLRVSLQLLQGRARFKEAVARRVSIDIERLPYRADLFAYLRTEKSRGRRVVLATAAHESVAQRVYVHLGVFDDVLASGQERNLKGEAKLAAIHRYVGSEFVYAGDCNADIPIWKAAKAAILVGVSPALSRTVREICAVEREFTREPVMIGDWLGALRVREWLKNLLLFVPMLTAFSFTGGGRLSTIAVAFLAFSLAASASYLLNDLADLDSDRAHPKKRLRPLASARISIVAGLVAMACCLSLSLVLALSVSRPFLAMLVAYLLLVCAYRGVLKRYVVVDVLTLSILYTLRIVAGAVAIAVPASSWLLAFSLFFFFSLALLKRCFELVALASSGVQQPPGCRYLVSDLAVLWAMGASSGLAATVVFGVFICAPEIQQHYASPQLLWGVVICLVYWLSRMWIKTSRGEMHYDPMVFAIRDRSSRLGVLAMLALTLVAHFVKVTG